MEERASLHEISADHGKTWTVQWLTPTEVMEHKMLGYATRALDEHYAIVAWSVEDIVSALEGMEIEVTPELVAQIRQDSAPYIREAMVKAGWGALNDRIRAILRQ